MYYPKQQHCITITIDARQDLRDAGTDYDEWTEAQQAAAEAQYMRDCDSAARALAEEIADETSAGIEIEVIADSYDRDEKYAKPSEWFGCDAVNIGEYRRNIWQNVLDRAGVDGAVEAAEELSEKALAE